MLLLLDTYDGVLDTTAAAAEHPPTVVVAENC
jgi:hypothetical protein